MRKQNESSGQEIHGCNWSEGRERGARQEQIAREQRGQGGGDGAMEEWRAVKGFEATHQISSIGRVRTMKASCNRPAGRILRQWTGPSGYCSVGICDGKRKGHFYVHALVAAAWIGERPAGADINHENGKKQDNRPDNLSYVSRSENMKHSFRIGINKNRGESHCCAKLKLEDVLTIRAERGKTSRSMLAKRFVVTVSAIKQIWHRRTWAHI